MRDLTRVAGFKCRHTGLVVLFALIENAYWNVVAFGSYHAAFKQLLKKAEMFEFGSLTHGGNALDSIGWLQLTKTAIENAMPISEVAMLSSSFYLGNSKGRYLTSFNLNVPDKTKSSSDLGVIFSYGSKEHRQFAVENSEHSPFSFQPIAHTPEIEARLSSTKPSALKLSSKTAA
ncbi:hypothetical protein [Reinekea sp. G2M2-21]|uniref:hypothetical protein n=1 Tax=Reinekea sp. G2M2-21 TaxID=2788942 RepID=UPI0018A93EF8|nr:hypothetical protein [Reinekea sp. G2M2-21]